MIYRSAWFLMSLLFGSSVFAQEQLGMRLSNFSGINGTMLNPAFNVHSSILWDVNVVAGGAFVENNYAFIRNTNVFKIIRHQSAFLFAGDVNSDAVSTTGSLIYDFSNSGRRKESYVNVFVTGPSAMFQVKEHTFGVFFNVRAVTSTNRVTASLNYYNLEALTNGDQITVQPFKVAGMAWSEVGFNYARNIFNKRSHTLNAGASFKLLQGYEAFYVQSHETVDITLRDDFQRFDRGAITLGLAGGISGFGPGADPYNLAVRGFGGAIDLGAIYYKQTTSKGRPYDWKVGVSLLDFGKIVFKNNAQAHLVSTDNVFDIVDAEYQGANTVDEIIQLASSQSLGQESASFVDDRFSMWMPGAVSIFAERAITNYFYINALMVRRLRYFTAVPERDNIWAITPRFEHRWFEVSLPLVLYNDKDPRMGVAIRLGPLTVGTDNLPSWIQSREFSGSDVYVALKINPTILKERQKDKDRAKRKYFNPNDCFWF